MIRSQNLYVSRFVSILWLGTVAGFVTTGCTMMGKADSEAPSEQTAKPTSAPAKAKTATPAASPPAPTAPKTSAKAGTKADAKTAIAKTAIAKTAIAKTAIAKTAAKPVSGKPDPAFQQALDRADSARSISQSAANTDDWELAASRWQQAIDYIKQIPKQDPNQKLVASKLVEFEKGLEKAQIKAKGQKVEGRLVPVISADQYRDPDAASADRSVIQIPIKYRRGGTPVVDVMFNNSMTFEMLFDTGATGTMISYDIGNALGLQEAGRVHIGTAAGNTTVSGTFIDAMSVPGKTIRNVPVVVGPVGLLGQDFYGDCDITIRQNVVELASCNG
jgi:predicted aspartyl protease